MRYEELKPFLFDRLRRLDKSVLERDGEKALVASLEAEHWEALNYRQQRALVAFRHKRQDDRLRIAKRVLDDYKAHRSQQS